MIQVFKEYKIVFLSLIFGILTKIILNIPLLYLFNKLALYEFYGSITASIIGYLVGIFISTSVMKKKYSIKFDDFLKELNHIFIGIICMVIVLKLISFVIPIESCGRFKSILITSIYGIVGSGIYFGVTYKLGCLKNILGINNLKDIVGKIKRK